ncbi:MAG: hypothetical protein Q9167_000486 [Letrouitia subvulpina]
MAQFQTEQIDHLQSDDQLKLLDEIDSLRSQGMSYYVSLPQLIVCGDQSSGKSSVLEAISGISFPTKDNLCTRFATEVILRRAPVFNVHVSIVPSHSRSDASREKILKFGGKLENLQDLPSLVEKATLAMGTSDPSSNSTAPAFFEDVLRLEISGPNKPHLTIVDLPGLIHSANKQQSTTDVEMVSRMVTRYMRHHRSVILAVVSAKNDYANQIVLKLSQEIDRDRNRTLGIITKPDTLPPGSESEKAFVELAQNHDIKFRLGWHVVRNRDYESRSTTTEARDTAEAEFFTQGAWETLPRPIVGIEALRDRLSRALFHHIKSELPGLIKDIQSGIDHCRTQLAKLGEGRSTPDEQRRLLIAISQRYQSLSQAALDGIYKDPFFKDPRSNDGFARRLRSVVYDLNSQFATDMRQKGQNRRIPQWAQADEDFQSTARNEISEAAFIEEIRSMLKFKRGRELPGLFNPLIIGDLFMEHSQPWEGLARQHVRNVWSSVHDFLKMTVAYISDESTAEGLLQAIVDPQMADRFAQADDKLTEILAAHREADPMTWNHYFTANLQRFRQQYQQNAMLARLRHIAKPPDPKTKVSNSATIDELGLGHYTLSGLVHTINNNQELDMDKYACSEALHCMKAYYKVQLKTFVDNVGSQVVEALLMSGLHDLLSPGVVVGLQERELAWLAGEPEQNQMQRDQLNRKLTVLMSGLSTCKRYSEGQLSRPSSFGWSLRSIFGLPPLTQSAGAPGSLKRSIEQVSSPNMGFSTKRPRNFDSTLGTIGSGSLRTSSRQPTHHLFGVPSNLNEHFSIAYASGISSAIPDGTKETPGSSTAPDPDPSPSPNISAPSKTTKTDTAPISTSSATGTAPISKGSLFPFFSNYQEKEDGTHFNDTISHVLPSHRFRSSSPQELNLVSYAASSPESSAGENANGGIVDSTR